MHPPAANDRLFSKHRLEALSDGVFAVVLTLLVLEIKPELPPHADNAAVTEALTHLARPLFGYCLAFLLVGIFWALHHRKFLLLGVTDAIHTALTFVFLFGVSLLPFSLSIYLASMKSTVAESLYFANFTLIASALLAGWVYAQRNGLRAPDLPVLPGRILTHRMVLTTLAGFIATAASYFNQHWIFLLLAVLMAAGRVRRQRLSQT